MDVAELRGLFIFDGVSDAQLQQLIDAGEEVHFEERDVLFQEGEPADYWFVLLEGRVELLRRAGREQAVLGAMERAGVWSGGFRAWDDSSSYLATGCAAGPGRFLRVPSARLADLAREWFPFGVHLISGFFQTVRRMDALSRQREALIALGGLAAGMAHEINNPASATARAVDGLQEATDNLFVALVHLAERSVAEASVTVDDFVALDRLRREIDTSQVLYDPIAVADCEDELTEWMEANGVESAWRIAPALAAAGVNVAWCERAKELLAGRTLEPGLEWVAATVSAMTLLQEAKESTRRITELVNAVKSYSQLDRAETQRVDIAEGLESTLVMLGHKLGNEIKVVRDFTDLPEMDVRPGELNQVWTNLIDNAIDAMDGAGTLTITTRMDGDDVVVSIGDTGPGMPADVQARAFEPFFTTKDVGKGTGLGLDISRRIIVENHQGEISIASQPGETVLTVRLPKGTAGS